MDNPDREPYTQSKRVQDAIRDAINMRYSLSHYLYTLFYISSTSGQPIVRPLWHEFPESADSSSQFMFGPSIMVAPDLVNWEEPVTHW